MSWEIVIFNSTQKIENVENIDPQYFLPVNFHEILEKHFCNIKADGNHRRVIAKNYSIEFFISTEPVSNLMLSLYGEHALFELVRISKIYNWQILDTGNGEMIDLENPSKNGYGNFETYLKQILK
jgi:hypothetical protein